MSASKTKAKQWLDIFCDSTADDRVSLHITQHAVGCPCRDISRPKLLSWLRDPAIRKTWQLPKADSAGPDELELTFKDPDPDVEEPRRGIVLMFVFPDSYQIPIIKGAWRAGSPHPRQGNCWLNPDEPPCEQRNRIRGRIS